MRRRRRINSVRIFTILANEFNKFYHETKILAEEDAVRRSGYISLLVLTKKVLESCIDLLGFEAPERM